MLLLISIKSMRMHDEIDNQSPLKNAHRVISRTSTQRRERHKEV